MDHDERDAVRDAGHDPENPAVATALDQVKRTLNLHRHLAWTFTASDLGGLAIPR